MALGECSHVPHSWDPCSRERGDGVGWGPLTLRHFLRISEPVNAVVRMRMWSANHPSIPITDPWVSWWGVGVQGGPSWGIGQQPPDKSDLVNEPQRRVAGFGSTRG